MPHNFIELIQASITVLKGKKTNLMPDFITGGMADFSQYNEGKKGIRIKVRAKIDVVDKKTIAIKEIPFSTTTGSLIDSIIKQNEKGKIKIKKVIDNQKYTSLLPVTKGTLPNNNFKFEIKK